MKKYIYIVVLLFAISGMQAQELLNYPLDTVNGEEVYRYQVEKSIGLYRVGVNFNVQQSEIVRLNPQLRERGLHYGETLLIPTGRKVLSKTQLRETSQEQAVIPDTIRKESPTDDNITVVTDTTTTADTVAPDTRHVVELALMLPFESQQTKRSGNAERMLEFYEGALLALRDMQNDSVLYRLRVYDTERSERRVNALCDSTELDNVQGILGLVYPIQIERVASWSESHHVPLLLPFSDDFDLATHSQVLQFNSTDQKEADSICAWILRLKNAHCVAIEVREADLASSTRTLRKQMKRHEINYSGLALRDLMNDSVDYALDKDKENIIILHSDRYQQARMVLPHLTKLQDAGYRIRIVSQYSWQKEKMDLPQIYTSMFTAEADLAAYNTVWGQFFKNEHVSESPRYDLLGYDLMNALVGWLHGKKDINGLQSTIHWQQVHDGGWQNTKVTVLSTK